ncbi:MAG: CHAD domain-containing protein [Myxococcales bacterium]|nr:CHAD domain-containing protein [Myxococcales bacterium]
MIRSLLEDTAKPHQEHRGQLLLTSLLYPKAEEMLLPLSQSMVSEPQELIHDIRVACRRWVEALDLVAVMVRPKAYQQARRFAQRLRKALSQGREAEVLHGNFTVMIRRQPTDAESIHAIKSILSKANRASLAELRATYPPKRLLKVAKETIRMARKYQKDLGWREIIGPHIFVRTTEASRLVPLMSEPDLSDAHHDLRVALKRLRYSAEITHSVFSGSIDESVPLRDLKKLQDNLGELQDSHDLYRFLSSPEVIDAVAASSLTTLQAKAKEQVDRHYSAAAITVKSLAPPVLGQLQRIAGKVGQLERPADGPVS